VLLKLVVGQGSPAVHALRNGADVVGWIRAGRVGFGGFDSREAAGTAAQRAAEVLTAWYEKRGQPIGHHAPESWAADLRDDDLVRMKDVIIGRLLTPDSGDHAGRDFAFELVLPPATWLAVMLQVAQRVHIELAALSTANEQDQAVGGEHRPAALASGAA
jgi:hypothetical protein